MSRSYSSLASLCLLVAMRSEAIDITVDVLNDPVPDGCTPGHCSLREAVQLANALPGADRILLPATPNVPLQLTRPPLMEEEQDAANGDLDISESVEIAGAGRDATVILQLAADRIFDASFHTDATTLRDLTVTGGTAGQGGAVRVSQGALRLERVRLHGNQGGHGGAVWYSHSFASDEQRLEIHASRLDGNDADVRGGAVYINLSGPDATVHALIADADFELNRASSGGALYLDEVGPDALQPVVLIQRSRFLGNDGGSGGAIFVPLGSNLSSAISGTRLTLENSTLCDNEAVRGGALWLGFVATLSRNTFCRNDAATGSGGAVYLERPEEFGAGLMLTAERNTFSGNRATGGGALDIQSGQVLLRGNTFVAPLLVPVDTEGTALRFGSDNVAALINNVIVGSCHYDVGVQVLLTAHNNLEATANTCRLGTAVIGSQNQFGVSRSAVDLGALADNGGPTQTHLPGSDSVALDAASQPNCVLPDQRGYAGGDGECDIGAVERDAQPTPASDDVFANGFEGA